jgi:RNA polymerase-associated protein CTR9
MGCMARDRGQIYKSSELFKEALAVNQTHPNTWSLFGTLHMSKSEWGPAQKKFEHILKLADCRDDTYSLVALGNVWLETLFVAMRSKDKVNNHLVVFQH